MDSMPTVPCNDGAPPFVWLSNGGTGLVELNCTITSHTPRNVTDKKLIDFQLLNDVQNTQTLFSTNNFF